MNLAQHFRQLDSLLADHTWLWRPQPFKQVRPSWRERLPGLCDTLLGLSDEALARLTADGAALSALLTEHIPTLATLHALQAVPEHPVGALADLGPHFHSGIPGRKWQQISAFATALGPVRMPLLEWCGGKGHLGRLLSAQWRQPVLTLEHDKKLCEAGERMARRAGIDQVFCLDDALAPSAAAAIPGRHAVALHACGELHRSLVCHAVVAGIPALDFSPCCYHLYGDQRYTPLTPGTRLTLGRDDLRLAVTETVTAVEREVRRRDQEMAWKLGFDQLHRDLSGSDEYHPIKPIDKSWLKLDFAGFCRTLATRDGIPLPEQVEWEHFEAAGWQRQRDTMRLSLVRHAFHRAIELWLVLDLANYLTAHGYRVHLGTFCKRELTPRNILISARLP
jgi:hypothetical protein